MRICCAPPQRWERWWRPVDGKGKVVEVNLLSGLLKVRLDANPDAPARVYPKEEVHLLRDGRIKVDQKEIEALKEIME